MTVEVEKIGSATLYRGNCFDVMPTLDAVDHVITDPPYSERTHDGHRIDGTNDGAIRRDLHYGCLAPADVALLSALFSGLSRGWIVWMCDHALTPYIERGLQAEGRCVFAPLPFFAPGSRVRMGGDGPSSWTIWIMVARTKALAKWGTLPGGYVASAGWRDRTYIGGKPVQLMDRLCSDYSRPGDLILDPFMGSGTTGVSCANTGRRFIGIEADQSAFGLSCERILMAQSQGRLFA